MIPKTFQLLLAFACLGLLVVGAPATLAQDAAQDGAHSAGADRLTVRSLDEPAPEKAAPRCTALQVRKRFGPAGQSVAAKPQKAAFSVREVDDLSLVAVVPGLESDDVVHVRLTTPKGHHYQTLDVPVAPPGANVGEKAARRLPGYPRPVPVRQAERTGGGPPMVAIHWPVAGTSIISSGLYGTWSVTASLDGVGDCPAASFTLTP